MKQQDDFELKRALDALPRSIEPPPDVWPEVRARIQRAGRPRREWAWPEAWEPRTIRIAAGIGAIGIGLAFLAAQTRANATWYVSQYVGHSYVTPARRVSAGEMFVTRGDAVPVRGPGGEIPVRPAAFAVPTTVLRIGTIGRVELAANTEVRQLMARAAAHRLALHRGMIHARIDAPPRLFVVETPSGTAIDLGCEYTLHVDSAGNSVLHVQLGWVEFTGRGRESLVPAGFMVISRPGGVGIPVRENATNQVRWAAAVLEQAGTGVRADSAVRVLETYAGRFDAVTLWHVLPRVSGEGRERIYHALHRRAAPPPAVTQEGALALDPIMLRLWWEALPGTLPITPTWTRRLWLVWLKAASWL